MPNPAYRSLFRKLDADAKKASEKREQQKKAMVAKAGALKKKQGESDKLVSLSAQISRYLVDCLTISGCRMARPIT